MSITIPRSMVDLHKVLSDWMSLHRHGIKQHSEQWHDAKKYCIGGSQMSTILGLNPYETIKSLISTKADVRPTRPFGTVYTEWGNIFESVLRNYAQLIFCTHIVGNDEFIRYSDDIAYSPDGLGIVPSRSEPTHGYLVLFEFKCPMSRRPSTEPPKYYVPQLLTGLGVMPMCAFSLYVEGVFRRCGWGQLDESMEYDTSFAKGRIGTSVLMYGFIGFRTHSMNWVGHHSVTLHRLEQLLKGEDFIPNDTNDLGICTPDLLQAMIMAVCSGALEIWYSRSVITAAGTKPPKVRPFTEEVAGVAADVGLEVAPTPDTTSDDLERFVETSAAGEYYIFGVLPYKLLKLGAHAVGPEPGYMDKVAGPVHDVVETIRQLSSLDPITRAKKFDEMYPDPMGSVELDPAAVNHLVYNTDTPK